MKIMGTVARGAEIPYVSVANAVRVRLDNGEWLPGEALPSMMKLGAEYGVSSATAARAVKILVAEGRLTTVKSWGTFVSDQASSGRQPPRT
jgi:GntR family transcriptional regulator